MASNIVCLFSVIALLVFTGKIEGELNKNERLTSFLIKYEITEISDIPRRSIPRKFDEVDNSERSFRITAFGNTFLIDLTVFFPREDVKIDYVSKFQNNTRTFYETDFLLYHGYVRNVNRSLVLGYFAKGKPFRGYVVTDEIFCIEPYESNAVIVYRFKDVITPGCSKRSEDEELDCAETRYFAPWYANRAPPIRLLPRYNLFYDKYLRFYQRLQAKKAESEKEGGHKGNSTIHGKDRGNKGDLNKSDRSKNKENENKKSKAKNDYSRGAHDIEVKSDFGTKTGYPEMIKITDKNEIREYIQFKREKYETKQEKKKGETDDDDDDDDDYIKISADDHRFQTKKAEAKKKGGHKDNSTTHGKDRGSKGDLNKSDKNKNKKTEDEKSKTKNDYSREAHDIKVKSDSGSKMGYPETIKITDKNEIRKYIQYRKEKNESKQSEEKDEKDDDDDDDDDDYIKISTEDRRFQTKNHFTPDKRSKNKTNFGQKSETKTLSTEYHAITHDIEYRTTTEFPKTIIITDQREIRKYRQYLKEKEKPETKKEKVENNENNEHYEKGNDKILRDDDRFTIPENNVAYQKHFVDIDNNSSETSRLDAIGSRNIMNHFHNLDFSGMWKESVEKAEKNLKQAVKREEKSYMEPVVEALTESHPVEAAQCYVQVIVSPSLLKRFDNDPDMLITDICIQFTLLNKILLKLPLRRRGKEIRFTLQVKEIVIYGDQVYSPFMGDRVDLEGFTKSNRGSDEHCLSIGLLNKYLRSGELYDGYTPEGQGGICSRNGNTLLISHGNEHTLAPMALYFASLVRGITRAMGAKDKNSDCQKGTYPNPMQILRDYILTEKIVPSPEYSIFTKCNVKEIEHELDMRACFYSVSQPLCGNAILDPGEECDCGPIIKCGRLEEGCNNPNLFLDPPSSELKSGSGHKGCTLKKNYECSAHEACCDLGKISKTEKVCYSGPFDCDIGTCDGKSASCPTSVEASNGMICSMDDKLDEPLICKDKKCDQLLCSSFDLKPCTCAVGTEEECLYCCMKDGRCQAAGIELTQFLKRNYTLPNGKGCTGGECINGRCETMSGDLVVYNNTMNKPPRFPAKSDSPNEFSMFKSIFGTAFSLLVLFLLKL